LFAYQEAIHVPLIVKMAAGEDAGRRVADVVQHVDLVPTILDLVKAPLPGGLRGRSLKPLLEGIAGMTPPLVYAQATYGRDHFGAAPIVSAMDGRYHYIRAPQEELYDLERDPGETRNLVNGEGDAREQRASLARALSSLVPEDVSTLPAPPAPPALPALPALEPPRDPKDLMDLVHRYREAEGLARDRKWAQAATILQQIARDDASLAEVWMRLAENAMRLERYEQAAEDYARVATLRPGDPAPLVDGAAALLKLRKLDDA